MHSGSGVGSGSGSDMHSAQAWQLSHPHFVDHGVFHVEHSFEQPSP